jgi:hypothetical protein
VQTVDTISLDQLLHHLVYALFAMINEEDVALSSSWAGVYRHHGQVWFVQETGTVPRILSADGELWFQREA